jgi:hypothetical protein
MLHLEHMFVWCWNFGASESRSEIPGKFEMWFWRRMENIIWTGHMKYEEVLRRVKDERNILCTIQRRKGDWIGHILPRSWLLKHIIEGKTEGTRRWGRRYKQLLGDLKAMRNGAWKRSTRSHCLENSLWKRLFTSCKTNFVMMNATSVWSLFLSYYQFGNLCILLLVLHFL